MVIPLSDKTMTVQAALGIAAALLGIIFANVGRGGEIFDSFNDPPPLSGTAQGGIAMLAFGTLVIIAGATMYGIGRHRQRMADEFFGRVTMAPTPLRRGAGFGFRLRF